MATTDLTHKAMGNPRSGLFTLYQRIDFSKTPMSAIGDDFKLFATKDSWLIVDSRGRMPTASTSTGTVDIGIAQNGTTVDAAIDVDGALTAWFAGDALNAAAVACSDGHVWLDCNTAAITDGVLEIMLTILAPPNDDDVASG